MFAYPGSAAWRTGGARERRSSLTDGVARTGSACRGRHGQDDSSRHTRSRRPMGIKTVMLTGDNAHTARAIAPSPASPLPVGDQLPEDKLRLIEGRRSGAVVGMVGDGINDAPPWRVPTSVLRWAQRVPTPPSRRLMALMDDDFGKIARFVRFVTRHPNGTRYRTSRWHWASRRCSWSRHSRDKPPCGWRCSPTWAPVCWSCSTVCGCCDVEPHPGCPSCEASGRLTSFQIRSKVWVLPSGFKGDRQMKRVVLTAAFAMALVAGAPVGAQPGQRT